MLLLDFPAGIFEDVAIIFKVLKRLHLPFLRYMGIYVHRDPDCTVTHDLLYNFCVHAAFVKSCAKCMAKRVRANMWE